MNRERMRELLRLSVEKGIKTRDSQVMRAQKLGISPEELAEWETEFGKLENEEDGVNKLYLEAFPPAKVLSDPPARKGRPPGKRQN